MIYSSSSKKSNRSKIFAQSSISNNNNSLKKLDNSELVETRREFRILKFQLEQYIERNYSVFDSFLSNIIETDLTKLKKVLPRVLLDSEIDKMDLGSKKNEVMNILKLTIYSPNNSNFLKFLQNRDRKEQQITRIQSPNRTNSTDYKTPTLGNSTDYKTPTSANSTGYKTSTSGNSTGYETPTPGNSTQNSFNQWDFLKFQFKLKEIQQILEKKEKNDITQVLGKKLLSLSKSSLNSPQELQNKNQELDRIFQNIFSIDHKVKDLSEATMDNVINKNNTINNYKYRNN